MLKFAAKSDIGLVRSENQDFVSYAYKNNVALGILCDGMGGHYNGLLASKTAVTEFKKYFEETDFSLISDQNKNAIQKWFYKGLTIVDQKMRALVEENATNSDMGTTLTMFLYFEKTKSTYIFNIGDSRTYLYNGFLHQVTKDQNILNYLIDVESWKPEEAKKAKGWDRLTSALGPNKSKNADIFLIHKDSNPRMFILTTDGIHDFISKPAFEQILQNSNYNLEQKCDHLIDYAMINKSNDNLTCLIMEIE
ncbi:PP2C family protein-serine/threonine phosphatase [[Mycoplasma] gypis]|uniref:PP2C family serine/threonine-protein phosphatase n=1 Tax=[Mycoplasma] gypis TaxID=92404 RepID=A0ABZ2RPN4_9BACT|nr:PP2C family serine/threonine-protein phosphatase [[Mycoplasma] gypis]MBN0919115.1 serine/threonine-protein phosphatase [[Mycoplasma] gypis]